MPVHDWTRVKAGTFHDFHQDWVIQIKRALNAGLLPGTHYAMTEQVISQKRNRRVPDVLALERSDPPPRSKSGAAGAVRTAEPRAAAVFDLDMETYRRKKNIVTVRRSEGDRVVAVIELLSPGNKASRPAYRDFLEKAANLLDNGVHLLFVDLFPPTPRDPEGLHAALWEFLYGEEYRRPADKPLSVVAYETRGQTVRAFVEPLAVGDVLQDMPVFLEPGVHVPAPLEATYMNTWEAFPERWRDVIAPPPG